MEAVRTFKRATRRFPDRTAIKTRSGVEYTYSKLDARSDSLAAALDSRLGQGRCASLLSNGSAAIEMMIAAQKRGQANAQLSFRGAPSELVHMVEAADAQGLVFDDANVESAIELLERVDMKAAVHIGDADLDTSVNVESYKDIVNQTDNDYSIDLNNLDSSAESAILYTSGSTGKPKAVLQDQERAWVASSQSIMEMSISPDDTILTITPWYHDVTTVTNILPALQAGATLVPYASFDPVAGLEAIENHQITIVLLVPTQLDAIVEEYMKEDYDISSLRVVRTGGAAVSPELVERTRKHFAACIHNTYGLTEGFANLTHAYPYEQADNPGTMGNLSFAWEDVRVVEPVEPEEIPDPDAVVNQGEIGEIIAKGPCADGYLNRSDENLLVNDWLRTGDLARVNDADGLHFVDRNDNMIVSGGENIYPQEVELTLQEYEKVEDVVVIGVAHEHWGKQVGAVVRGDADEAELDTYCQNHEDLADFKRPRKYVFTNKELPRSDTGTLLRERIHDSYFNDQ